MGSFGKMSKRIILLLVLVAQQGTMEAWRPFPAISREDNNVGGGAHQSSTLEERTGLRAATKFGMQQLSDLTTEKKEVDRLEGLLLMLKLLNNQNKYARFT